MSGPHRSLSASIACLVCGLVVIILTAGYSGPPGVGSAESGDPSPVPETSLSAWATIDFESVSDMDSVEVQGIATFAWLWHGALDSDKGGSGGFANEPSPDTVAMLWDDPYAAYQTRISFVNPVKAVIFDYSLDTTFGALTVVAYDESGVQTGSAPLDVCGAISCGNSCSGDPTGELCDFNTIEIIAQPGRGISRIEFDGPSEAFARFALDDFTYFEIHPIFVDDFETGDTARWFAAVGLPPPCTDIEVGPLMWLSNHQVRIETVRNTSTTHSVVHTRTKIDWDKYRPYIYLDSIRFDEIGFITQVNDSTPPTDVEIEIPFDPDQSSRFTAAWNGWPYPYCQLGGEIEVTLFFRSSGSKGICTETRSVYRPPPVTCPHDTPTPTSTPTWTATPTSTSTVARLTPTPTPAMP
jgi:hypothetical protein